MSTFISKTKCEITYWRCCCCCLMVVLSFIHYNYALLSVPDNARVVSEVHYASREIGELYEVEEFIDKQSGSIRLRVIDSTIQEINDNGLTSYYRINELIKSDYDHKQTDKSIISFSNLYSLCTLSALDNWHLKQMTNIISRLNLAKELNISDSLLADSTAIGPLSLLKIFYENIDLLVLEEKAFDENRLLDTYYFKAKIYLKESKQFARLICLQPFNSIQNLAYSGDYISLNMTTTTTYPTIIAVVIYDETDKITDNTSSRKLLNTNYYDVETLIIGFSIIEKLSANHYLGQKLGTLDDINPFTLPPGSGCGKLVSKHNPLYVGAKQFSGLYDTNELDNNKKYIAFDSQSNHLRLDVINEYKLIVDLKKKNLVYVSESSSNYNINNNSNNYSNDLNKIHCAQTTLLSSTKTSTTFSNNNSNESNDFDEELFMNAKVLEDILGINKYIGLSYLGTSLFEDGTHCLVFEREINYDQIPLINKLNLLSRLLIRTDHRFFLIFYIVNEMSNGNDVKYNELSYESMWIKRIDLLGYYASNAKTNLYSRVTFSEFVWSLESMSEETRDRESKEMHPVRTFDLIECSTYDNNYDHQLSTQLELLIKQLDSKDWQDQSKEWASKVQLSHQAETLEEGFMTLLLAQTRIPRSYINELEILTPYSSTTTTSSINNKTKEEQESYLLLRANLIEPLPFKYELDLLGWIKSMDSIPFEKYGTLIKTGRNINRFVCQLKLATQFDGKEYFMIYCPNIGCGYINALNSFEYISKDQTKEKAPKLSQNYDMCEIHLLRKVVNSNVTEMNNYSPAKLQNILKLSPVSIDMGDSASFLNPLNKNVDDDGSYNKLQTVYRAIILKCLATVRTIITGNNNQYEMDSPYSIIKRGACYKLDSKFLLKNFNSTFVEFKFDLHHNQIHCDKICQMTPFCLTYSYQKKTRTCLLTNIDQSYFNFDDDGYNEMVENFMYSTDCNIYETNPLNLYNSIKDTRVTTLSGLFRRSTKIDYVFISSSLLECAQLCRSNEFDQTNQIHCQSFQYFRLNSICALKDKNDYLFEKTYALNELNKANNTNEKLSMKENFYKKLFGVTEWSAVHSSHSYYRDYSQYYINDNESKVQMMVVDKVPNKGQQQETKVGIEDVKSLYSFTLYDIDVDRCLIECTVINPACVMVDYCFHPINGIPTRHCDMHSIRSPMTIKDGNLKLNSTIEEDAAIKSTLTEDESLFYVDGVSENHKITMTIDIGCRHYYLDGDNLFLKRQILDKSIYNTDNQILDIANDDLNKSINFVDQIQDKSQLLSSRNGLGFLWTITIIISGLAVGIITTLYGPKLSEKNYSSSFNYLTTLNLRDFWHSFIRKRTERTNSTSSRLEMTDILDKSNINI